MTIFPENLIRLAEDIIKLARIKKIKIVTAESCTGGLISACLTAVSGASDVFDSGFATYSNKSKTNSIGVPVETIKTFGAVSNETAMEMAMGASKTSEAQIAISTTGIAGPGGCSKEKPLGLVYIGFYLDNPPKIYALRHKFEGDRASIRIQAVENALGILKEELEKL